MLRDESERESKDELNVLKDVVVRVEFAVLVVCGAQEILPEVGESSCSLAARSR